MIITRAKRLYKIIYTPAIRFLKNLSGVSLLKKLSGASLFTVGFYMLLPTPDEAFIHPLFGSLLSHIFCISFKQGLVISFATYTAIGIILCLVCGGKQIYKKVKTRFTGIHKIGERPFTFKCPPSNDTTYPCSP